MVSVSGLLIVLIVAILLYRLYKYMFFKPPNFPPGPPRLPLLGGYIWLLLLNYNHFHKALDKLCKYYKTDVLGMYLGNFPTIAVNGVETVKEALLTTNFDGKPPILLVRLRDPDFQVRGLFFTEGPFWKHQRRYTLRHLRDYGFGRRFVDFEIDIAEEIGIMIDIIRNGPKFEHEKKLVKNRNIVCPSIIAGCASNCILKIFTNERMIREDQDKLFEAAEHLMIFSRKGDALGKIFSVMEWTATLFPKMTKYADIREASLSVHKIVKKIVDEQLQTYDPNHERSIIDLYIKEMKDAENKGERSFFTYEQLVQICIELLTPTATAIPLSVAFLLQKLVLYPEIQKKIHREIDEVVGQGRLPTLDDRINMPYTEASIREILRLEPTLPNGIPHGTLEDTTFRGYDIPKGTVIITNLYSSLFDESKWKSPIEFRPERYLDSNGKLNLKKDFSVPFGAGKRLCAGETFSRNMLFLITSALLQNFTIKEAIGYPMPTVSQTGLLTYLPDFVLKFESR